MVELFGREDEIRWLKDNIDRHMRGDHHLQAVKVLGPVGAGKTALLEYVSELWRKDEIAVWWLQEEGEFDGHTVLLAESCLEQEFSKPVAYLEKRAVQAEKKKEAGSVLKDMVLDEAVDFAASLVPGVSTLKSAYNLFKLGRKVQGFLVEESEDDSSEGEITDPGELLVEKFQSWLETDPHLIPEHLVVIIDNIRPDEQSLRVIAELANRLFRAANKRTSVVVLSEGSYTLDDNLLGTTGAPTLMLGAIEDPTNWLRSAFPGITKAQVELCSTVSGNWPAALSEIVAWTAGKPRFFIDQDFCKPLSELAEQRLRTAPSLIRALAEDRFHEMDEAEQQALAFISALGGRIPRFVSAQIAREQCLSQKDDSGALSSWLVISIDHRVVRFASSLHAEIAKEQHSQVLSNINKYGHLRSSVEAALLSHSMASCNAAELMAVQSMLFAGSLSPETITNVALNTMEQWLCIGAPRQATSLATALLRLVETVDEAKATLQSQVNRVILMLRCLGMDSGVDRLFKLYPSLFTDVSPQVALQTSLFHVGKRDYEAAAKILNKALRQPGVSALAEVRLRLELADVYTKAEALSRTRVELDQVRQLLRKSRRTDSAFLTVLELRLDEEEADLLERAGSHSEALAAYLALQKKFEDGSNVRELPFNLAQLFGKIGSLQAKLGFPREAEASFLKALAHASSREGVTKATTWPSTAALTGKLARTLRQQGCSQSAIHVLEETLKTGTQLKLPMGWRMIILRTRLIFELLSSIASLGEKDREEFSSAFYRGFSELNSILSNSHNQLSPSTDNWTFLLSTVASALQLDKTANKIQQRHALAKKALSFISLANNKDVAHQLAVAFHFIASLHEERGETPDVITWRSAEVSLLSDCPNPDRLISALTRLISALGVWALRNLGEERQRILNEAREYLSQAMELLHARPTDDPAKAAQQIGFLAKSAEQCCFYDNAINLRKRELELVRAFNDSVAVAFACRALFNLECRSGNHTAALPYGKEYLRMAPRPDSETVTQIVKIAKLLNQPRLQEEIDALIDTKLYVKDGHNEARVVSQLLQEAVRNLPEQPHMLFDLENPPSEFRNVVKECAHRIGKSTALPHLFVRLMADTTGAGYQESELRRLATLEVLNEAAKVHQDFIQPRKSISDTNANLPMWGRSARITYLDKWLQGPDRRAQFKWRNQMAKKAVEFFTSLPPSAFDKVIEFDLAARLTTRLKSWQSTLEDDVLKDLLAKIEHKSSTLRVQYSKKANVALDTLPEATVSTESSP